MPRDHDDDLHRRQRVETWVRCHQVHAWRYVRLRGAPPDLADDLVQEALLAAVQKGIDGEPDERARGWLRGALDNLWRMHLRSEGRRAHHVDALAAARALDLCEGDDNRDGDTWLGALRGCLANLDGRARQLLDLHYTNGASREAIATAFGMRENGVKAFLRRVRDLLRQCMHRRLGSEGRPGR